MGSKRLCLAAVNAPGRSGHACSGCCLPNRVGGQALVSLAVFVVAVTLGGCAAVPSIGSSSANQPKGPEASSTGRGPLAAADPVRVAQACLVTARDLARRGEDAAALGQFERAVSFDATLDVRHERAVLLGRLGRTADAAGLFATLVDERPEDSGLRSDYGFLLYSAGDLTAAEHQLREARRLARNDAPTGRAVDGASNPVAANLACVLAMQGRYDEARGVLAEIGSSADVDRSLMLLAARAGDAPAATTFADRTLAADDDQGDVRTFRRRLNSSNTSTAVVPVEKLVP